MTLEIQGQKVCAETFAFVLTTCFNSRPSCLKFQNKYSLVLHKYSDPGVQGQINVVGLSFTFVFRAKAYWFNQV